MIESLWLVHPEQEMCDAFAERFVGLPGVRVIRARFEQFCPEGTFMETLRQVVLDLNLLGNGYLEVARDKSDRPESVWWAPATDLRRLKDLSGYVQTCGGRSVRF